MVIFVTENNDIFEVIIYNELLQMKQNQS